MTARDVAVRLLTTVRREGAYSNILLENTLSETALSAADKALATRLVYGVLERQITLDWCLAVCADKPLKKLHPFVVDMMRVAAYQLLYMERIPASAAVNEAVKAVKKKQPYAAGVVNGVLRGLERRKTMLFSQIPEGDEGLSIRYSCPVELITFWRTAYGATILEGILESINDPPPSYVRINTMKTDSAMFIDRLKDKHIPHTLLDTVPNCVRLDDTADLGDVDPTWYYFQDVASQYACLALGAQPGERVADVCAAPGGKTFTTAQYMLNDGLLLAGDVYPVKCDMMDKRAGLLGLSVVQTVCRDAATPPPPSLRHTFDRVICDVPCSGLGVIRRKPEIRYKSLEACDQLPSLQKRILEQAARLVKPGGVLQYSTCTLNPAENEEVAQWFLQTHPDFAPRTLEGVPASGRDEPVWYRTLFPSIHHSDGFFIAGFVKRSQD